MESKSVSLRHPLSRQRGASIVSLVLLIVVLGFALVVGLRVVPTFVEYRAVLSAIKKAQGSASTVAEIQKAFDRSAAIDDIETISGKDLDIAKVNDELVVSFAYTKKIPIVGPVNMTIDYSGNSKSL